MSQTFSDIRIRQKKFCAEIFLFFYLKAPLHIFSKNNRAITVGPLQTFMNQLIPDGALVKLHIYEAEKLVETKTETSNKGYAIFKLSSEFYTEDNYKFIIETLGISKKFENINYAK